MRNGIYSLKIILFVLIFILFVAGSFCSKKETEPIIARSGKVTIPLSEFHDRYEFTPHLYLTKNTERNKRNVLIALLGEKLLVEEAERRNLTATEKFKTFSEQMEKEAIIEALFEEEVSSKIQISDEEVRHGFLRSQQELDIQVLSFDNKQQALEAKKQIDAGKSFNQVKREFQTDAFIAADSVLTLTMKWGEAHPALEDVAYRLNPGEVSEPVEADNVSFIMKLVNRRANVFLTESDYLQQAPSIRKKIKQRKRAQMLTEYMQSVMAEKQVRVSHQIFDFVAGELEKVYPIQDTLSRPETSQGFIETPVDSLASENLADHLDDVFARFSDGSTWTVGEFIKKLSIGPYRLSFKSSDAFRNSLRRIIRKMVEFESLVDKAKKLGLQDKYYVRYQTKMWSDAYLAQQLRQEIIDTVSISDEEVRYFYNQNKNNYTGPDMVNIQEILVDDEGLAHRIFQRIKNGEDVGELARKYNKREISQKNNGVMGYFSASSLGKIGEAARNLKIGEIGGPVKTENNQFSVFKLLDKTEAGPLPMNEVLTSVRRDALSDKRIRAIDDFLVNLADQTDIKVNQSVLDTMTTVDINMLVLKQHFLNRTAAPLVTPLHKSYRWQNLMREILP